MEDQKIDNNTITAKIKSKILMDPALSVLKVEITTHNSIVKLSGNVNSEIDAEAVEQLARSTNGVNDVDSKLKIQNSHHTNNVESQVEAK